MHTCILLCALGILVALQVPGSSSKPEKPDQKGDIISSDPKEIVDKHNALRRGVQPSPSNMLKMEWNNEAAANAERWAQTCSIAHSPPSKREIKTSGCGENLFMSSSKVSWSKAIQYWYDEIKDWRYGVDSTGKVVLHFTQVVWYNSNKVGCALVYCPNSRFKYLYFCQYCPPGNNQKGPPYKAGPKCGDCPNNCDNGLCIGKGTAVGTANFQVQVPGSSSKPEKPDQKSNPNPSVKIISSDPKEIVDKHNALRGGVQPSPSNMLKMEWNNEAAANAERWAQTCSMAHSPPSKREIKTSGCGENLFMSSSQVSWSKAIQYWYDEIKDWRYGVDSTGKVVLHFTQVVWYNSNKVGCALVYCPNSRFKYLYVCQYCPPGNNQKGPPYKAGPKCGDCPNNCVNGLCIGKGTAVGTANFQVQVPGSSSKPEKPDQKSNIISSDPKEIVDKHNALRLGVQPSPSNMLKMEWNNEAAANAERWAQTCSMAHSPASKREIKTSGCGENLFMSSSQVSWSKAIQYWYDEIKDWRYGVDSKGKVVLNFTQVVWYNSNKVGCALAYCPNSRFKYLYVCQYCPPGYNQKGPPYKAGPKCGDCPNNCDNGLCRTAVGTANPCPYVDKFSNCPALVKLGICSGSKYDTWCPASCKCTNKI